jgi:hypothetical protein
MMNDVLSRFQDRHNGHCHFGAAVFAIIGGVIPALRFFVVLANNNFVLPGFEMGYRAAFSINTNGFNLS